LAKLSDQSDFSKNMESNSSTKQEQLSKTLLLLSTAAYCNNDLAVMKMMSAASIPEKSFVLMNATVRLSPLAMILAFLKSLKVRSSDLLAMKTFLLF